MISVSVTLPASMSTAISDSPSETS